MFVHLVVSFLDRNPFSKTEVGIPMTLRLFHQKNLVGSQLFKSFTSVGDSTGHFPGPTSLWHLDLQKEMNRPRQVHPAGWNWDFFSKQLQEDHHHHHHHHDHHHHHHDHHHHHHQCQQVTRKVLRNKRLEVSRPETTGGKCENEWKVAFPG